MREAQEVERLGFPFTPPLPVILGEPPKLEQPGLVRVQLQPKLPQSLPQLLQECFRFGPMLKPHDEVVGVANQDHVAPRLLLSPSLHP